MHHHADDDRHPHLQLVAEDLNPDRRRRPAPPGPRPGRGGRQQFAGELRGHLDEIEEQVQARPAPPAGIQPHLVFRVPLAGTASPQTMADMLTRLGITVVSIESDKAIIAFSDDANLGEFREAIETYEEGPRINPQTGELYAST